MRHRVRAFAALGSVIALVASCTGNVEDTAQEVQRGPTRDAADQRAASPVDPGEADAETPGSREKGCEGAEAGVGASPLRRLSNLELQLTLQELFQLAEPPSIERVPRDTDKEGFKSYAALQPVSAQHIRAYAALAAELADGLLADPVRRSKVLGCEPEQDACLASFVARFGRLAYRRPLLAEERDGLVERAERAALDRSDAFRFALQSLLTSANFLYRVEVGDAREVLTELTPDELVAKLSFGLWGRGPSEELLDRAESGALASDDALRRTAAEMLDDPRVTQFYAAFFRQWLGYDELRAPSVLPADWSDGLLGAMQAETDALMLQQAFGGGSLLDVFTTNRTELTPALARFYELPVPERDGSVSIPMSHPRAGAGLLGHASLLSAKGDGDLIAIRGNWLRRTFLCSTLEIPASVAEELGELLVGLTRVEIVKKRNTERACKGCHALIDPIGIGLSMFDASGRFDEDADLAGYGIEPALPDAAEPRFSSLAELAEKLQALPEVSACLAEKVFIYVNGRDPTLADRCTVAQATTRFAESGHGFSELLESTTTAPSFRLRRASDEPVKED